MQSHAKHNPILLALTPVAALVLLAGGPIGCEEEAADPGPVTQNQPEEAVTPLDDEPDLDDNADDQIGDDDLAGEALTDQDRPRNLATNLRTPRAAGAMVIDDGSGGRLVIEPQTPAEVRAGEAFTYSLAIHNEGDAPMHNVVLRRIESSNVRFAESRGQQDALDQQNQRRADLRQGQQDQGQQEQGQRGQSDQRDQRNQQGEDQQQQSQRGQQETWRLGTLPAGETRHIEMRMIPEQAGQLHACLAVQYDPVICADVEVIEPELEIQRIAPERAYICDDIQFEYVVRNVGSGTTDPVTIVEDLPRGLSTADGERTIRIDAGEIAEGEQVSRTVNLRAEQAGEFRSAARAETSELGVESRPTTVRILDPRLDVRIHGPQREYLDRPLTYNIVVENTSGDPAADAFVTVPLPENIERPTYAGADMADDGRFALGDIGPGESREFSVTFTGIEPGDVDLTAEASAYCADAATGSITTSLRGIAALRVETIDLTDPVRVGENTVYQVQLKNQGTATSINVRATADLPEGLTFVEAEGDSGVRHQNGQVKLEPIPELNPGDVAEWLITCRAEQAGKVRFKLHVQSDATRRQVTEVEPTTIY